jgi:hypothetical protein
LDRKPIRERSFLRQFRNLLKRLQKALRQGHKRTRTFGNLVLVSWLQNAGKDVIYVQNTQTNDVQKITSEPNLDNFRIVELHPNADPKLFVTDQFKTGQ